MLMDHTSFSFILCGVQSTHMKWEIACFILIKSVFYKNNGKNNGLR